jgi:hypothetical protein
MGPYSLQLLVAKQNKDSAPKIVCPPSDNNSGGWVFLGNRKLGYRSHNPDFVCNIEMEGSS